LCCCLYACSQPQGGIEIIPAKTTETLTGVTVVAGETDLLVANGISLTDSAYILVASSNNRDLFNIYRVNDNQLVSRFGMRGMGPNDFTLPLFVKSCPATEETFSVFDVNIGKLSTFRLRDSRPTQTNTTIGDLRFAFNLNRMSDSVFVGTSITGYRGLYYTYNTKDSTWRWAQYETDYEKRKNIENPTYLYYCALAANAAQGKVVVALRHFNRLLMYDTADTLVKELQIGEEFLEPINENVDFDPNPVYFTDAYGTDKYFYALWKDSALDNRKVIYNGTAVYQFDWNGKYIRSYTLDKGITQFAVARDDTFLLGLADDGTGLTDVIKYALE
jgi:hypothetical protein